jgi:hypothetical protein
MWDFNLTINHILRTNPFPYRTPGFRGFFCACKCTGILKAAWRGQPSQQRAPAPMAARVGGKQGGVDAEIYGKYSTRDTPNILF